MFITFLLVDSKSRRPNNYSGSGIVAKGNRFSSLSRRCLDYKHILHFVVPNKIDSERFFAMVQFGNAPVHHLVCFLHNHFFYNHCDLTGFLHSSRGKHNRLALIFSSEYLIL